MLARECFADFQRLFPTAANAVLDSLDPLQRRNVMATLNQQAAQTSGAVSSLGPKTNGTANNKSNTSSLTRQGKYNTNNTYNMEYFVLIEASADCLTLYILLFKPPKGQTSQIFSLF